MDEVEKNNKLSDEGLEDARSEGMLNVLPLIEGEVEAGNVQLAGKRMSNDALSESSSTKTKSAQLSGNGYSEEMEKIFQHTQAMQTVINQQPTIGNGNHVSEMPHDTQVSDLSIPPGFGNAEDAAPLGFVITTVPDASPPRKIKGIRRIIDHSAKRLTRSQVKQSKKNEAVNQSTLDRMTSRKKGVEGSPKGGDSASTTESIVKLARESIEIGKVLGIKVISNEAIALKQMTATIKNSRLPRTARS